MRLRRRRAVTLVDRTLEIVNTRGHGKNTTVKLDGIDISPMLHAVTTRHSIDGPPHVTLHANAWPIAERFVGANVLAIFDPDPPVPVDALNDHIDRALEALRSALDVEAVTS